MPGDGEMAFAASYKGGIFMYNKLNFERQILNQILASYALN